MREDIWMISLRQSDDLFSEAKGSFFLRANEKLFIALGARIARETLQMLYMNAALNHYNGQYSEKMEGGYGG